MATGETLPDAGSNFYHLQFTGTGLFDGGSTWVDFYRDYQGLDLDAAMQAFA